MTTTTDTTPADIDACPGRQYLARPCPLGGEHQWRLAEGDYIRTWSTTITETHIRASFGGSADWSESGSGEYLECANCLDTTAIPAGFTVEYDTPSWGPSGPPEPTLEAITTALHRAHHAGRLDPAAILVRMLAPAGALADWDSETIELVLSAAEHPAKLTGVPWIGDTGADGASHLFWARVAHATGWIPHNWEPVCDHCGYPLDDDSAQVAAEHRRTAHPDLPTEDADGGEDEDEDEA